MTTSLLLTPKSLPRRVHVTDEGVLGLAVGLVEDPEVGPGGRVRLVELYGAHVGLERVEGLVLLLVEYAYAAPGVGVALGLFHRVSVNFSKIRHFVSMGFFRERFELGVIGFSRLTHNKTYNYSLLD